MSINAVHVPIISGLLRMRSVLLLPNNSLTLLHLCMARRTREDCLSLFVNVSVLLVGHSYMYIIYMRIAYVLILKTLLQEM